jgi:2-polyprenyl-6-methoxyphenol hydroxylase-like FAD-dependent oxidoreductase
MSERIIVVGAGVAGLFAAMMLAGPTGTPGRTIALLDRDPPPPEEGPDGVFNDWKHHGVGHLRHSHAFLARLINIMRERHPKLLEALTAAGAREAPFADMIPSTLKDRYTPEPGDERMSILFSRRTTLELVARRYVAALPGVSIESGVFVAGLLSARNDKGQLIATGVKLEDGTERIADVVIDAGGRMSGAGDWLADLDATIPEESESAGILYYTRHWKMNEGQAAPPRDGAPGAGDLGYLKYGVFNADNGWFSVTLAAPEVESELRARIVDPAVFDAICRALPGVAPWIDPARATPQTKVFGMGDLNSRWRSMVVEGEPLARGIFLIGDGLVRSNPLYGRGCTFAAIEAEALARAFDASADPKARAVLYDRFVDQALRPFYDDMRQQDRAAIRRAEQARTGASSTDLRSRLMRSFIVDGAGVAVRDDLPTLRAALRGFHMLEPPRAWLKEPRNIGVVLKTWARGKTRNAHLYPQKLGPERAEMLAELGLAA